MPLTCYTGPEALEWLRSNKSECGLAGNRFRKTVDAISFVEALYTAGATRVFIPDNSIRDHAAEIREYGGPYADSCVIVLPEIDRQSLFELYEKEAKHEGYEDMSVEDSVVDGKYLYIWWD